MSVLCYVDTNVLVYVNDNTSPYHDSACSHFFKLLEEGRIVLHQIVLAEFYSIVTGSRNSGKAWSVDQATEYISQLKAAVAEVHAADVRDHEWAMNNARRYGVVHTRIYDFLIAATMNRTGVRSILTVNERDFKGFDFIDDRIVPQRVQKTEVPKSISYGRQAIDDSDVRAVTRVLRSDFLTCGPAVTAFEKQLCAVTGAKHAVACSNGTTALHLACMALGIKNGDLGVTSPNTFLASANCIEYCGGRTDFVDIDPKTLCLSPDLLEEYCKSGKIPKVVIPVDFAGVPADLPAIWELAKKYGFKVIEDAAHSLGSTYTVTNVESRKDTVDTFSSDSTTQRFNDSTYSCASCSHSDLAILSFHPVKTITTGEGGAITTNDDKLAERLRLFRSHGMTKNPAILQRQDGPWYYEMHELGFNYRITDLQCALGSSQLKKLGDFKTRRQKIVNAYNAAFANIKGLICPTWPENTSPCFHLYPVQFSEGPASRRRMYDQLAVSGINCQVHYYPVHLQPYYKQKYGYAEGKCSAAEEYYSRCLSLPLFPAMSDDDVERVIEEVRRVTRGE